MRVVEVYSLKLQWSSKMKFIITLLLLSSVVFASSINDSLLKVHATLLPKLYLMDYKFKSKLIKDTIKISLVYTSNDYKSAESLKNKIYSRYANGLKSYKIDVKLIKYHNLKSQTSNIFYFFPASSSEIKHAVSVAKKSNALTFSYLKDDLHNGVMISLAVGKDVKPILNLNAIKINNINLRPVLIDISIVFVAKEVVYKLLFIDTKNLFVFKV